MNLGGPEGKVILNDDYAKKSHYWSTTVFHTYFKKKCRLIYMLRGGKGQKKKHDDSSNSDAKETDIH